MSAYKKDPVPPSPQKFNWIIVNKYNSFEEADEHRKNLLTEDKIVKVSRMGVKGSVFAVKIGKLIEKKMVKEENKIPKKPHKNDKKAIKKQISEADKVVSEADKVVSEANSIVE